MSMTSDEQSGFFCLNYFKSINEMVDEVQVVEQGKKTKRSVFTREEGLDEGQPIMFQLNNVKAPYAYNKEYKSVGFNLSPEQSKIIKVISRKFHERFGTEFLKEETINVKVPDEDLRDKVKAGYYHDIIISINSVTLFNDMKYVSFRLEAVDRLAKVYPTFKKVPQITNIIDDSDSD